MSPRYDPQAHILPLDVAPRAQSIVDQREITIQSYQTTVAFDYEALYGALDGAWLTPQIRFGVFSRSRLGGQDAFHVVLGLQDELRVRTYDYDERQPIWFTWRDVIVDTVGIHYFKDEDGLLRFTTTGGGRRITDELLHKFNSDHLGISKDAVVKRQFDLDKLRALCFDRFAERLYMLRFSDPSGQEYQSIDHALFQSREYIDPDTKRLKEIQNDAQAKIESFDSDVTVRSGDLAAPIKIRFFIRGLSGSLRLRFPKISYKNQIRTVEDQARIFYRLVDRTVREILDADYYTQERRSLEELEKLDPNLPLFPDLVDLAPFREVLTSEENRRDFLSGVDVDGRWNKWQPHLRAIDELLLSDAIRADVAENLADLAGRDPARLVSLLSVCREDPKIHSVGSLASRAVANALRALPAEMRAHAEEGLLAWAIEREKDSWDVEPTSGVISVLSLRWTIEDLAFDALPPVLWKLVGLLHARVMDGDADADVGALLDKLNWCMVAARELPVHHAKNPAALRLVAAGKVPSTVAHGVRVLKEPVADLRALDEAVLDQFGLPMWPLLAVMRDDDKVVISNTGIGSALAVTARPSGELFDAEGAPGPIDVLPGASVALPIAGSPAALDISFEKLGKRHRLTLPVKGDAAVVPDNVRVLTTTVSRKRRAAQRDHRAVVDPNGIVVGSSPALLKVFEDIRHANMMDGAAAVLIVGERGTGKTHVARLLHDSSDRASRDFKEVNAGGGGGDLNIQRGEWIGYGRNHGIQGIDRAGRAGHLVRARGGTLFVDEFAALSPELQYIFLSVLDGSAIEKVGGESVKPDVRCIFATNADVDAAVEAKTLRADLIDRIPVTVRIPPLRDRRGDILLLAKHFAGSHTVSNACLAALMRYGWPGNVRELKNKMNAATARMKGDEATSINLEHVVLPDDVIAKAAALDEDACRRELWTMADEIARGEGLERGDGLQKRAGEIMGVGQAQASKMYAKLGLASPSSPTAQQTA